MSRPSLVTILVLVLALVGAQSRAWARPGPFVPAEDPVYDVVDELRAQGLLPTAVTGHRPWTRSQVLGLLDAAAARLARGTGYPSYLAPRVELLRRRFRSDEEAAFTLRVADRGGLQPWNDFGRDTGEGLNLTSTLVVGAPLGRRGSLTLAPEWTHAPEGPALADGDRVDLHEAVLSLPLGASRFVVGRQPLSWGFAATGSLLMGTHARPLDQVRFESDEPFNLRLGPVLGPVLGNHLVRYQFFLANLGPSANVPNANLAGMRVDLRSSPHFEVSLQRCVVYGGERDPDPDYDFWDMLFGWNENGEIAGAPDPSNGLAGFGFRHQGSLWGSPTSFYAENYGEDLNSCLPTQKSWIWGVHMPSTPLDSRLGLRYEELTLIPHAYLSGRGNFIYHGLVLGHPADRDSRLRWMEASWHASAALDVTVGAGVEDDPTDERYNALDLTWLGNGRTEGRFFVFRRDRADTTDVGVSVTRRW